jgi:hypothetical protein
MGRNGHIRHGWIVDMSMNLFIAISLYLFVDKSINRHVDKSILTLDVVNWFRTAYIVSHNKFLLYYIGGNI